MAWLKSFCRDHHLSESLVWASCRFAVLGPYPSDRRRRPRAARRPCATRVRSGESRRRGPGNGPEAGYPAMPWLDDMSGGPTMPWLDLVVRAAEAHGAAAARLQSRRGAGNNRGAALATIAARRWQGCWFGW